MTPEPYFGILCLVTAYLAAFAVRNRVRNVDLQRARHTNLDGLQGLLTLVVFVSHAATWQQYLSDGRWRTSDAPYYTLIGQMAIILFFMRVGFTFATKLLDHQGQRVDWVHLYCARILRLYPAYLLALAVLVFITLNVVTPKPPSNIGFDIPAYASWLAFTVFGAPLLNGATETNIAIAGVTWPLTYFWAFYLSLPLLAGLLGVKKTKWHVLIGSVLLIVVLRYLPYYGLVYYMLLLGVVAALLCQNISLATLLSGKAAGAFSIALLILAGFIADKTAYNALSISLVGVSFYVLAAGNSLGGFLTQKTLRVLGLGAYSLYLLHGPFLFVVLKQLQKNYPGFYTNDLVYWSLISLASSLLVWTSLAVHLFLEVPAMCKVAPMSQSVHKFLSRFCKSAAAAWFHIKSINTKNSI